ncbi:hypothetical protein [Streptomyces griseoluteus]|uniref:hypothetical protein n=1 Tax=Streptomyces griseoluteus TaxID=29306 RepID=UPI001E4E04A0|nr:hypothetical protein [Streptomyces griseoluteus]
MSGEGGMDLQAQGLEEIAKGLTEALGELGELGMAGQAGAGRGFSGIALSGLELGHEGLTGELKTFCERWEWGVRAQIAEGNAERTGVDPWEIQDWLFRFDPELEARGWEFWDLTRAADGSGRLNLWLDTWGEPMFSWEEPCWLLYACGAQAVTDPVVVGSGSWAAEATV